MTVDNSSQIFKSVSLSLLFINGISEIGGKKQEETHSGGLPVVKKTMI